MSASTTFRLGALGLASLLCTSPFAPVSAQNNPAERPAPATVSLAPKAAASHPNLVIAIRREGIGKLLEKMQRNFAESKLRQHVIVGTPVSGTTQTSGEVFATLDAKPERVDLLFELKGQAYSPFNTASQGPARVYTRASTSLGGVTRVAWDGRKLVADSTQADCQTRTTPLGVSVQRQHLFRRGEGGLIDRMIRNAAAQRAAELRPRAEAESSAIAEAQTSARMNQEVAAKLAELNKKIEEYYVEPLDRAGMWAPSRVKFVDQYLALVLTQPDHLERAAEDPADLDGIQADFVVGIHETSIAGFFRPIFSGAFWSDADMAHLQKLLFGEVSEEFRIGDGSRWSVVFDSEQPISAKMGRGGLTLTMRGQQATIDGEAIATPWSVEVAYQLQPTSTSLSFHRQGDIAFRWRGEVAEANPARDRAEQVLRQKFAALFQPTLYLDGLELPRDGKWAGLQRLHIDQVKTDGKWLYLISLPEVSLWTLNPEMIRQAVASTAKREASDLLQRLAENQAERLKSWQETALSRLTTFRLMLAR